MDVIDTQSGALWLDDEGILHAVIKPCIDLVLEEAKETIIQLAKLADGKRRPILVDMTELRSMEREARLYFAGPETAKVESAAALLVRSPLAKAVGNFFMGINKPIIPTRLFSNELDALAWLRGYLHEDD